MSRLDASVACAAAVRYRLEVLDAGGRLVSCTPWKKNLILDQGLDAVAARPWADNFANAAVGTGTTPTRRDSGAITVSRAGTTLTASAGFFEAADAGRLFKFDTGEEVRIQTFTDATHVETVTSGTIAAAEGTIYYVNQIALAVETKRSIGYTQDSGDNGTAFLTDTLTLKRSFLFSAEVGTVTYREIGWSHLGTSGNNLFGRDVFAGGGVTLIAGQQLKAIAELSITLSPASSTAFVNPITGWGDDGVCGCEYAALRGVAANGTTDIGRSDSFEPSGSKSWALTTSTTAIAAMTNANPPSEGARITCTASSYVSGSFERTFTGKAAIGELNATNWRSIIFGERNGGSSQTYRAFRVLMNSNQTKLSTHTLELTFKLRWGRILTN